MPGPKWHLGTGSSTDNRSSSSGLLISNGVHNNGPRYTPSELSYFNQVTWDCRLQLREPSMILHFLRILQFQKRSRSRIENKDRSGVNRLVTNFSPFLQRTIKQMNIFPSQSFLIPLTDRANLGGFVFVFGGGSDSWKSFDSWNYLHHKCNHTNTHSSYAQSWEHSSQVRVAAVVVVAVVFCVVVVVVVAVVVAVHFNPFHTHFRQNNELIVHLFWRQVDHFVHLLLWICVRLEDDPRTRLNYYFDPVADKIKEVQDRGGRTLLHCVAGVSRSASLTIAYLVKHKG